MVISINRTNSFEMYLIIHVRFITIDDTTSKAVIITNSPGYRRFSLYSLKRSTSGVMKIIKKNVNPVYRVTQRKDAIFWHTLFLIIPSLRKFIKLFPNWFIKSPQNRVKDKDNERINQHLQLTHKHKLMSVNRCNFNHYVVPYGV